MFKIQLRWVVWVLILALTGYAAWKLDGRSYFTGDNLNKLIQAKSILDSGFKSEELSYPAQDLDSDFTYYPYRGVYMLVVNGKHFGQYPIALTFPAAVFLKFFPPHFLLYAGAICFLFTLLLFDLSLKPHPLALLFAAVGTPLLVLSLDFSEHAYFVLLNLAGTVLWMHARDNTIKLLIAGFLIGISMFLRLEAVFYFCALAAGIKITTALRIFQEKSRSEWVSSYLRSSGLRGLMILFAGFSISFGLFLIFNQLHYGHLLGPRFLANATLFQVSLMDRVKQTFTLLFMAKYQLGFFGYSPILLMAILILGFNRKIWNGLENTDRAILISVPFFLIAVSFASPGEGVVNWGPRFLLLAVLPSVHLLSKMFRTVGSPGLASTGESVTVFQRYSRVLMVFLFVWSLGATGIGISIQRSVAKQLKDYQTEFLSSNADIWVFSQPLLAGYIGLEYFERKTLVVMNAKSASELATILKEKSSGKTVAFFEPVIPEEFRSSFPPDMAATTGSAEFKSKLIQVSKKELKKTTVYVFRVP